MFDKPIFIFDLETTGLMAGTDRIVQFAGLRIEPNGIQTAYDTLVNPEMPIPPEVSEIHGITDKMVEGSPSFERIALKVQELMKDAILSGYNVRSFDWPFLQAEFHRNGGAPPPLISIIDVLEIYRRMVKQNLSAAFRHYTGMILDGAHSATADVEAAFACLTAQKEEYNLPGDMAGMEAWFKQSHGDNVDPDGKFVWKGGSIVCNFGKNQGKKLSELDNGFLNWMKRGSFTGETIRLVECALRGEIPRNREEVKSLFR